MAALLKKSMDWYNYAFYEVQDVRTRDWFPNFIVLITILVFYNYFCNSLGLRLMKNRRPYKLRNIILVYNIFQIFISAYLFVKVLPHFRFRFFYCEPVDYSENPELLKVHNLVWIYCIVKLIDLLDTVFFVLRKNIRQISRLHLFHHTMMPIASYIAVKYYPNGHAILLGKINCFVHVIMYTYYLIAGLGPNYQKYLWWKHYVTVLQIVQFLIIFCQNLIPLIIGCDYPKWINVLLCINSALFVYLFGSFYYENYVKKINNKNVPLKQKKH